MGLAESLQEVVGEATNVADLANAAFSEILGDYPDMELQWLRLLHQAKSSLVYQPHCLHCTLTCTVLERDMSASGSIWRQKSIL